jgi:hypothetical protein
VKHMQLPTNFTQNANNSDSTLPAATEALVIRLQLQQLTASLSTQSPQALLLRLRIMWHTDCVWRASLLQEHKVNSLQYTTVSEPVALLLPCAAASTAATASSGLVVQVWAADHTAVADATVSQGAVTRDRIKGHKLVAQCDISQLQLAVSPPYGKRYSLSALSIAANTAADGKEALLQRSYHRDRNDTEAL